MIPLEQLLDGLDVSVEPVVVDEVRPCSGGTTVNCSAQRVVILPPGTRESGCAVGG